jgi:periplasmic mercuric ion binding protein
VKLDLETGIVSVEYVPKKTSPDAIRTALTKLGYYADDIPGDEKAFRDLPDCCQKEGCGGTRTTPHTP